MTLDHEPLRRREILDLAARHEQEPEADLPRWQEAREALDRDDEAFEAALEVDPLLLFQRLPDTEVDAGEVAEMRRSVHELRRSREIESRIDPADASGHSRKSLRPALPGSTWRLAAALATLLLGASLLLPTQPESGVERASGQSPAVELAAEAAFVPRPAVASEADHLPLVEDLDGSMDLIQIEAAEMSVVVASLPSDFEI